MHRGVLFPLQSLPKGHHCSETFPGHRFWDYNPLLSTFLFLLFSIIQVQQTEFFFFYNSFIEI